MPLPNSEAADVPDVCGALEEGLEVAPKLKADMIEGVLVKSLDRRKKLRG